MHKNKLNSTEYARVIFDTPTLLVVLIVSNFLMAGAMWIAFAGRFRDGLGQWTGALVVQGVAWLLLVAAATSWATSPRSRRPPRFSPTAGRCR